MPDPLALVLDGFLPLQNDRPRLGRTLNLDEGVSVGLLDDADRDEAVIAGNRLHDGLGVAAREFPERGPQCR